MPLLVLPPRYTADSIAMSRAAAMQGWKVERLSSWNVPEWLCGEDVVVYGEPLFVSVVAPVFGIELLQPSNDWLPSLPQEHRHRAVRLTEMAEARRLMEPAFIKPVDDKCFRAALYTSGSELPPATDLPDSELVLISDPVKWTVEFRAFVLERQVVTFSPYLRNGELALSQDGAWSATDQEIEAATTFCETILSNDTIACPPAFVLDVGIIQDKGWAVVEANPAWGSGLYGCDPQQVLSAVKRACSRAGQFAAEDNRWVRR